MTPAQKPTPRGVTSLDGARLDRLLSDEAAALAKLATVRAGLDRFRRAYSTAHGFRIVLSVEQVRRDMGARS